MTNFATKYSTGSTSTRNSLNAAKGSRALSLKGFLDIFSKAMMMVQAVPDTGRVNQKQLAKVRAIATSM